nr:hypothetical protein [Microbulbifer variabilis]
MGERVEFDCKGHKNIYECPDDPVSYIPKFDEFSLIVHDGGSSSISIKFCPWYGLELPGSKRDEWFDKLESMVLMIPLNKIYQRNSIVMLGIEKINKRMLFAAIAT